MSKYVIMGEGLEGCINLEYHDTSGMLVSCAIDFELTEKQAVFLHQRFPTNVRVLLEVLKPNIKAQVVEVKESYKFADFWKRWDNKQGKIDCEKAWQKLTENERVFAVRYINAYKQTLQSYQPMLMGATYLNKKRFMDYVKDK